MHAWQMLYWQIVQTSEWSWPSIRSACCHRLMSEWICVCVKGIYRLSGVKSHVEMLCQSFETDEHAVNLSQHHPNVIANVLKYYFRQVCLQIMSLFVIFVSLKIDCSELCCWMDCLITEELRLGFSWCTKHDLHQFILLWKHGITENIFFST